MLVVLDDDVLPVAEGDVAPAFAGFFPEEELHSHGCIGISSWSATLLVIVDAMHQIPRAMEARVVQILGGASESPAKTHAVYLASQLATLVRGEVTFLTAPGIVGSKKARDILLNAPYVRGASRDRHESRTTQAGQALGGRCQGRAEARGNPGCTCIGAADMAYAIRTGRLHRANNDMAFHVLDVMHAIVQASGTGRHIELTSTCERPAALPEQPISNDAGNEHWGQVCNWTFSADATRCL